MVTSNIEPLGSTRYKNHTGLLINPSIRGTSWFWMYTYAAWFIISSLRYLPKAIYYRKLMHNNEPCKAESCKLIRIDIRFEKFTKGAS